MPRSALLWIALVCLLPGAGACTICQSPEDVTYAAFGGAWERHDPVSGRVGSAFHPAEGMVMQRGEIVPGSIEVQDVPLEEFDEFDEFDEGEGNYLDTYNRSQFSR